MLPRTSWDDWRKRIKGWDKLGLAQKEKRFSAYTDVETLLEANQILRRPPVALTGLVISPDGHILTSTFNLGDDLVFKDRSTGKPGKAEIRNDAAELIEAGKDLVKDSNPVEKIIVTLPDGSQKREDCWHATSRRAWRC